MWRKVGEIESEVRERNGKVESGYEGRGEGGWKVGSFFFQAKDGIRDSP